MTPDDLTKGQLDAVTRALLERSEHREPLWRKIVTGLAVGLVLASAVAVCGFCGIGVYVFIRWARGGGL